MGEMADFALEHIMDIDEMGKDAGFRDSKTLFVKCKYCGKNGLVWGQTEEGKFRLYNPPDEIHICEKYRKGK